MISIGQQFAAWSVICCTDPTGKRATCQCRCGKVRAVAIAALLDGSSTSCGCAPLSRAQSAALRDEAARQRRAREWWGGP